MDIDLIGYGCGAGAGDKSCKSGASKLKLRQIESHLVRVNHNATWVDIYQSNNIEPSGGLDSLPFVLEHCSALANQVEASIKSDKFPLIFGGDHSMAIGSWSGITTALNACGDFGLMWLDAHMDAHTPESSETGNIHGMPLAVLLGSGAPELTSLKSKNAKLNTKHVVMIGIRSYEQGEYDLLTNAGVRIYYMEEIKQRGFDVIYKEAMEIVSAAKKGFGISFDIDAFDADLVPGTGTRESEGLRRREVLPAMQGIAYHPKLKAIEVAEYNPELDKNNQTYQLIEQMVDSFFAKD